MTSMHTTVDLTDDVLSDAELSRPSLPKVCFACDFRAPDFGVDAAS
jgi:hypothetical protein